MSLPLDTKFDARHGEAVAIGDGVLRVTAPNGGPMTFQGTNTYLVGDERMVVIDPGPADHTHLSALEAAISGREVAAILLTHGHRDHSDLAKPLAERAAAPIHASSHFRGSYDVALLDGEVLDFGWGPIEVVATPGHTADHLCFALPAKSLLFSGDHVMAWSTTVVGPPDGRMSDYMRSLERLMDRPELRYLPGHGGPVERPQVLLRALRTHRRMREAAILNRLAAGPASIDAIVADLYRDIDPALRAAAALSVRAHLDDLSERRRVTQRADTFHAEASSLTPPE